MCQRCFRRSRAGSLEDVQVRDVPAVNIRKFVARAARLHDLVALGSLTEQAASFLGASVPLQSRRGSLSKVHPNARSIGAARVNRPPMPWGVVGQSFGGCSSVSSSRSSVAVPSKEPVIFSLIASTTMSPSANAWAVLLASAPSPPAHPKSQLAPRWLGPDVLDCPIQRLEPL